MITGYNSFRGCCTQCGSPVGPDRLEYRELVGAWPVGQYLCGPCCDGLDAKDDDDESSREN